MIELRSCFAAFALMALLLGADLVLRSSAPGLLKSVAQAEASADDPGWSSRLYHRFLRLMLIREAQWGCCLYPRTGQGRCIVGRGGQRRGLEAARVEES